MWLRGKSTSLIGKNIGCRCIPTYIGIEFKSNDKNNFFRLSDFDESIYNTILL